MDFHEELRLRRLANLEKEDQNRNRKKKSKRWSQAQAYAKSFRKKHAHKLATHVKKSNGRQPRVFGSVASFGGAASNITYATTSKR